MAPQPAFFYSEGCRIAGDLCAPQGETGARFPAVALCRGFDRTKEALLPPIAEVFANAGDASWAFDYRGFGQNEGERVA
jgi:uncharacterized protein